MIASESGAYNKTQIREQNTWTAPLDACITKPVNAGGRPTNDPKGTLVAVRLSARQVHVLEQRSQREDTGLSEAIRRCIDEWAAAHAPRAKASTRTKKEVVKRPAAGPRTRPARRPMK